MGMVFCRGCGKEIHESAPTCPLCGAPQSVKASGRIEAAIPDGVKGWSWGAFLLNWVWAIGNKTWIGLLAIIPYVGLIMAIILGFKGREWAWKNKEWESVEHFNRVQRKWSAWGLGVVATVILLGILAAIAIPQYASYKQRKEQDSAALNEKFQRMSREAEAEAKRQTQEKALAEEGARTQFLANAANDAGQQYTAKWQAIQASPGNYLSQCESDEFKSLTSQGGLPPAEARNRAKRMCASQLAELKACMNRPSANAANCFQDVLEHGG